MTLGEEIGKGAEPELSTTEFPRDKGESHSSLHSAMHQGEAFGQDLEMLQELGEAFSACLSWRSHATDSSTGTVDDRICASPVRVALVAALCDAFEISILLGSGYSP